MKIYVFGNQDVVGDNKALAIMNRLKADFPQLAFETVNPNADLPFGANEHVYIMDAVDGIDDVCLISGDGLDKLITAPSVSVHDFDLGFQLRYLNKLKKLGKVTIIGVPIHQKTNYLRIQSIFKKLVAQDIHGS